MILRAILLNAAALVYLAMVAGCGPLTARVGPLGAEASIHPLKPGFHLSVGTKSGDEIIGVGFKLDFLRAYDLVKGWFTGGDDAASPPPDA